MFDRKLKVSMKSCQQLVCGALRLTGERYRQIETARDRGSENPLDVGFLHRLASRAERHLDFLAKRSAGLASLGEPPSHFRFEEIERVVGDRTASDDGLTVRRHVRGDHRAWNEQDCPENVAHDGDPGFCFGDGWWYRKRLRRRLLLCGRAVDTGQNTLQGLVTGDR